MSNYQPQYHPQQPQYQPYYQPYPQQQAAPKQKKYTAPKSKKKKYIIEWGLVITIILIGILAAIVDNIKVTFDEKGKCYVSVLWVTVNKHYCVVDPVTGSENYNTYVKIKK